MPGNTGSAATNVKEDFGNEVLLVIRTGWRKWYLALLHMKKITNNFNYEQNLNLTVTQSIPSTEKIGLEQCQTVIAWTVCS